MSEFYAGLIHYLGAKGINGREWFEMVPHAGGRTLRAFCEMDDIGLSRDVSMALDAQSRPVDGFARIIQQGHVRGTTLFMGVEHAIECEGITQELGRVSQRRPLAQPLQYLGLHPLVGDALVTISRGRDRPGEFRTVHGLTNSHSPNGELGLLAMPSAIDVAYLGDETLDVPAGRFAAQHFALRWRPEWPVADLWVHGPLAVFLRLTWSMIDARYELVQLRRER